MLDFPMNLIYIHIIYYENYFVTRLNHIFDNGEELAITI